MDHKIQWGRKIVVDINELCISTNKTELKEQLKILYTHYVNKYFNNIRTYSIMLNCDGKYT